MNTKRVDSESQRSRGEQLSITNSVGETAPALLLSVASDGKILTHSPLPSQAKVLIRKSVSEIHLTTGEIALVDTADLALVIGHKWCGQRNTGSHTIYAHSTTGRGLLMHRVIMGLEKGDLRGVDHIDGNGLNNCRENLRICTQSQNRANARKFRGKSRYRGVIARGAKWGAEVRQRKQGGGVQRWWLGLFETQEEAAAAYDRKAIEVFGGFTRLNLQPQAA